MAEFMRDSKSSRDASVSLKMHWNKAQGLIGPCHPQLPFSSLEIIILLLEFSDVFVQMITHALDFGKLIFQFRYLKYVKGRDLANRKY